MPAIRKNPPKDAAKLIEDLAAQGHAIIGIARRLGVAGSAFKRWLEEDEALQEAFDVGRETERQALHNLIVQAAAANKPANANAMFLLKCRHNYREQDSASNRMNVDVRVAQNVMVVHDFGTDEEWEARAATQQRALVQDAGFPSGTKPTPQLSTVRVSEGIPAIAESPQSIDTPCWRGNA